MAVIKTAVPQAIKDRVENFRKNKGMSEAELVRKAVTNYLDTQDKSNSPLRRAGLL